MEENLKGLRALCFDDLSELSPFQIRTRFERHLYGLVFECSTAVFGSAPNGLSKAHVTHFCEKRPNVEGNSAYAGSCLQLLHMISDVYERFTELCDTSNWSDDGQDPRINACRDDILSVCGYASKQLPRIDRTQDIESSRVRS
jgi:hypothetical protein